jgi:hypothetical protein
MENRVFNNRKFFQKFYKAHFFFGPKISLIKTGAKKSTEAINELVQTLIDRKIENVLIVLWKICKQSEGSKRINSEELFEWFLSLLLNLSDHKADVQTQVDRRPVIFNIEFKYKYFIAIIELNFKESVEQAVAKIRGKSYFKGMNESYKVVTLMNINYCEEESNIDELIHITVDKEAETKLEENFELNKDGTLRISTSKKFLTT